MIINKLVRKVRKDGFSGLLELAVQRAFPPRMANYAQLEPFILNKTGLEIGGPSEIFDKNGIIPLYSVAQKLDNCTFRRNTLWTQGAEAGVAFDKGRQAGTHFISEASNLSFAADNAYDFVVSSHVLEHLANPILGLHEWTRILKPGGVLLVVVPHRDGTFDHRRPVTSFEHLKSDFENQVDETDLTHVPEVLSLHDLERDPGAGDFAAFKRRSHQNIEFRGLHHHVFNTRLVVDTIQHVGLTVLDVEVCKPFHIIATGQKLDTRNEDSTANGRRPKVSWRSPFPSDA